VTYIYLTISFDVQYICPTKFSDVSFCPTKFKLCPTKIKNDRTNVLSSQIFICSPGIGSFQKRSTLPPQRKFPASGEGGEKKLFLIIVNVLGHPKGVRGLTSNFLRGGGMDVF
jgi:hypothetical protein